MFLLRYPVYNTSHNLPLNMLSVVDSLLILNENIFFRQWRIDIVIIVHYQYFIHIRSESPNGRSITDLPVKESYLTFPEETLSISFIV